MNLLVSKEYEYVGKTPFGKPNRISWRTRKVKQGELQITTRRRFRITAKQNLPKLPSPKQKS
jgi:hypothetical protein